ncbi:dipeptide ABC transporter ATP-binding protein [Amaricoccus macauensis]|uniref:dipeptide ABC transporter ATP-binding protein n=1 Tax=Amaricoccus macauensis TaxID=57001 RepID=UPI00161D3CA7
MSEALLSVEGLAVEIRGEEGVRRVVEDLSFSVAPGETLTIAGESGSGKSLTALTLMGLLPGANVRVAAGRALWRGTDLMTLPEHAMRRLRGGEIAMIFQEPMTSLNPVMRIGSQLEEAIRAHDPDAHPGQRALELLGEVRIPEPARRLRQYPHELSGGQRQRVMIAMALAGRPKLLIADEPTTALDVTVQAQILALLRDLQARTGVAIILITHDMGVVAEMATRVLVLRHGRKVEEAPVRQLFAAPAADYTRELLAAVPRLGTAGDEVGQQPGQGDPVCEVKDLTVAYTVRGGLFRRERVSAVNGLSFSVGAGETLALVGESGCGKSTTGRALLNLVPWEGEVRVMGRPTRGLSGAAMRPVLREVQMVFQDPYASLDPRMTVGELVGEPLAIHRIADGSERHDRVAALFTRVGLAPEHMRRHPHEFSGGQRQRICIARALALEPRLIVADESVSALDVSVKAHILALLAELQETLGLAYLFISHDLAVVEQISRRVAVMVGGRIVEIGMRGDVFGNPSHPYTRRLLAAAPVPDPDAPRPPIPDAGPLDLTLPLRQVGNGHLAAV